MSVTVDAGSCVVDMSVTVDVTGASCTVVETSVETEMSVTVLVTGAGVSMIVDAGS